MKVCQLLENDDWDNHSVMATDRTLFKIQKAQTHNFVSFCFELVRKYKPDLSGQYLQTASFFLNDAPRVWYVFTPSVDLAEQDDSWIFSRWFGEICNLATPKERQKFKQLRDHMFAAKRNFENAGVSYNEFKQL